MQTENTIDTALISIGSVYSLTNIREILGIIILCIQIIWFTLKIFFKIYRSIKNKHPLDLTNDDINELTKTHHLVNENFDNEEVRNVEEHSEK